MRLPESVVQHGLNLARGCTYLGVPLEELTREELLAVAAEGWNAYTRQLLEGIERMKFLSELWRAR